MPHHSHHLALKIRLNALTSLGKSGSNGSCTMATVTLQLRDITSGLLDGAVRVCFAAPIIDAVL